MKIFHYQGLVQMLIIATLLNSIYLHSLKLKEMRNVDEGVIPCAPIFNPSHSICLFPIQVKCNLKIKKHIIISINHLIISFG
jgi:hypothetical protein